MPDLSILTKRQRQVYDLLAGHADKDGRSAMTCDDIAEAMGMSARSGVTCHLEALERKGFIRRQGKARRPIVVLPGKRCPYCKGTGRVDK